MTMLESATYGVHEFVRDARRIMEVEGEIPDREAAVRELEPLLRRALGGPGWTDPEFAAELDGRRGYEYYRNQDSSLQVYGVLFRQGRPTPVHDHVTWGLIGVYSGEQRTTRYWRPVTGGAIMARRPGNVTSSCAPTRCSRAVPCTRCCHPTTSIGSR
jgi:predicted metal-dependent enzyme (double-stranded beta helix superfamily)